MRPNVKSLILYKKSPALVQSIVNSPAGSPEGEKFEILLPNGKSKKVRTSDIQILHPGPCDRLSALDSLIPEGNPQEAWEMLMNEETTFSDLAELIYDEYSPGSAWGTFKLLNRSPWFRGTPDAVEIIDAETSSKIMVEREKKAKTERLWQDFLQRLEANEINLAEDEPFLRDLEMCAIGVSKGSRILKAVGKTQSPENAHRFMLSKKIKPAGWNPHPLRLSVSLNRPEYPLMAISEVPRMDLSQMESFAIDDEGNKDPDDAIALADSTFWVHVADAAAIIPAESEADLLARERASSLYLPETTVPMLPESAVKKLGLGLQETSPALSYAFPVDSDGNVGACEIHLTTVRVSRLTYAEAESRIDKEPFKSIMRVTEAFRKGRESHGAISINMPEVKLNVDIDGKITVEPILQYLSRGMVSESMLIAGAGAAKWCLEKEIPIPFVCQESSGRRADPEINTNANLTTPSVSPGSNSSGEMLAFDRELPRQYQHRRGMKRSRVSIHAAYHTALGLETYTRITSPLRRYTDLLASRQIRNSLLGQTLESEEQVATAIASTESQIGSLIQTERRSNLFWKINWLHQQEKWTGEAIVLDSQENKGYFVVPELALEIWVRTKQPVKPGQRVILQFKEADITESMAVFAVKEILSS